MPRRYSPPHGTYLEAMNGFSLRLRRGRRRPGTQRLPGRFRRMLSNRILWPGMFGIALAVGFGVQMGESAIAEINPIHFQGAAARPQGIDPAALPPPPQSAFAQAYGWEQGNAARQADSGFEDFDYVPQQAIVRPAAEPVWQDAPAPATPATLTPWPPGRVSSHPEVERYIDYPIEDKVADQPAAAAASTPPAPEEKVESGQ